jgi:co-chaperonin GroES (HSP10)
MAIADLIVLLRDELLVRVDPESAKVGEIFVPSTAAQAPSVTARVLAVGPESRHYQGDERVVLSLFSGTTLALEGIEVEDQVRVVKPEHVLAWLYPFDHVDLTEAKFADLVHAPPAHLLVEREEMPLQRGKIHIPPNSRTQTRAHEAVVVHVGAGVPDFERGERVLLTTMVLGRSIAFGIHPCRTLWLVTPSQVLCKLRGEPEEGKMLTNQGEHALAHWQESPILTEPETGGPALDEGDPRGLR